MVCSGEGKREGEEKGVEETSFRHLKAGHLIVLLLELSFIIIDIEGIILWLTHISSNGSNLLLVSSLIS